LTAAACHEALIQVIGLQYDKSKSGTHKKEKTRDRMKSTRLKL
jgi:hypothetical protein